MATLVLQVAGTAIGTAIGGPLGGAIGSALGGLAGSAIDQSLMGGNGKRFVEGPRLKQLDGITASEGAPVPRIYGRARLGGQVIWATRFEEEVTVSRQGKSGGKSTRSSAGQQTVTTSYRYFANLAVALCEGPVAMVRRVWADGKPLDLTTVTMRFYTGDEGQAPDPLIIARQGVAPAYRGTAYVVFERLPLAAYGNRLPQLSFEVIRPVTGLAQMMRGVDLIPGATEFGYTPAQVSRVLGLGSSAPENRNQLTHGSDFDASLDALQRLCPYATSIALVGTWFGNDLRAGHCVVKPGVDMAAKTTTDHDWSVAGIGRGDAHVVSQIEGRAAYGGTPSDRSILTAIANLKARGLSVVFYPFVMMDVPAGNALPDPWTGAASQPPYPWRGRITCHPAPGRPGTPDGTGPAAAEIAAFFGTVNAGHFSVAGGEVSYSGPNEWTYSRLVLHMAALCKAAGGVDAFLIGSELVGLTRVRSATGVYPAVQHLKNLAADVRAILGPSVKIGYGADWTEYGAHVLGGGAEVRFPLDPLWADAAIDFVGIDYYPPVSDWREGGDHLDAEIAGSGTDVAYLTGRLGAGEAFDWYYAGPADRDAQIRTPITDGAYDKPWIYRAKDLVGWWSNPHVERSGGVETATTGWTARSKPIWLTEIGCPAVHNGAASPNLFPDPKSSESGLPPFSTGARDDLMQARFLEAVLARFDPDRVGFQEAYNPVSPVYGGRMVDPARIHVWAWDARPYPAFPHLSSVWGDGANWTTGHWITGRIEGMPLDRLIAQVLVDFGLPPAEYRTVDGFLDGYVIDRPMSVRAALEPLEQLFAIDASVTQGSLAFTGRGKGMILDLPADALVPDGRERELVRIRAQETELPRSVTVSFVDAERDYKRSSEASRRLASASHRDVSLETPAVLTRGSARTCADIALQDLWIARETAEFSLPPSWFALEPGDCVRLPVEGVDRLFQITAIADGDMRKCRARAIEPEAFGGSAAALPLTEWRAPEVPGPAHAVVLKLPVDPGEPTPLTLLALRAEPWGGPYTVWRATAGSYEAVATVGRSAVLGETLTALPAGPCWRWDRAAMLDLRLPGYALPSLGDDGALAGTHTLAIRGPDGAWEMLSFAEAELIGQDTFRIRRLLRGLAGSEPAASRICPAGAPVVLLDGALVPLFEGSESAGDSAVFRISPAGRDHADPAAISLEAEAGPQALMPYSPVRVRARRGSAGVEISWIRRTRRGGNNWDILEVPLAEAEERYVLDILNGATVLRTLEAAAPGALYGAADEIADFGAPQASLRLRIRQVSQTVGPGNTFEGDVSFA